jgi:hypothetical protein
MFLLRFASKQSSIKSMNDVVGKQSENMRRFLPNIFVNRTKNSNIYLTRFSLDK